MELDDALALRLTTQRLAGPPYADPVAAVRHLLAVQAQDAPLARWSLAMRSRHPADSTVRATVDAGTIVRTHVLRPTWHYVSAEDLGWLLALTAPKVLRSMASRNRFFGLDDPALVRAEVDGLVRLLAERGPLTRRQVVAAIGRDDLKGERLGRVIGIAELEGLVCSGPHARGQHTYTLVEGWVPPTPPKARDDAVRELTLRFLTGHGPASAAQLVRWCTLTKREVLGAVAELGDALVEVPVGGEPHWHASGASAAAPGADGAFLLPVFDEAYLSYPGSNFPRLADHPWGENQVWFAEAGGGVVVHARRDVGWWKRKQRGQTTAIDLDLSPSLPGDAVDEIHEQARALATFTGRRLELVAGRG